MRRLATILSVAAFGALNLTACATAPLSAPTGPDPAAERGRDFAIRRCAGCHTVGLDDGGAQDGPSFRAAAQRHNAISLQRRFAEVAQHGFDRMPPVSFTAAESEDLIAYLQTLRP
ncbi:MAG: cytochrome c [Phenylobacterium sp.]|nr:cytochrome c [Phenylobacterium sp.]